jgi:hypothetical protein
MGESKMKTNSQLLERAYAIAESQFYSDDECEYPWEPFEDYDKEEIERQVHELAQTILQAMEWAQNEN